MATGGLPTRGSGNHSECAWLFGHGHTKLLVEQMSTRVQAIQARYRQAAGGYLIVKISTRRVSLQVGRKLGDNSSEKICDTGGDQSGERQGAIDR